MPNVVTIHDLVPLRLPFATLDARADIGGPQIIERSRTGFMDPIITTHIGLVGAPALTLPEFDWATVKLLLIPTITIALLGAIESLLSARVADSATRPAMISANWAGGMPSPTISTSPFCRRISNGCRLDAANTRCSMLGGRLCWRRVTGAGRSRNSFVSARRRRYSGNEMRSVVR